MTSNDDIQLSRYPPLIANAWVEASGGKSIPVLNPATGQAIGTVAHASIADLDRALAAATARQGVAEADLFPTVRLSGFIGLLAGGFESLFTGGALAFSGGPSLDWGVFDMPRLRAQVRVADARTDAALIEYHRTVLIALRDVEDALTAYGAIRTSLAMRTEQTGASREAARMASVRFREGEGQYLDVLAAERSLYEAEATLVETRAQHLLSVVEIHRALGGGWEVCEAEKRPICSGDERSRPPSEI